MMSSFIPHLIYCQDKLNKDGKEEKTVESYIFEIFDSTLPRYRMKKRLGDYVKFLDDEGDEWKEQTDTEKLPMSDLIYAKRRTRSLLPMLGIGRMRMLKNHEYGLRH